jgi:HK97 family phage portal protein
MKNPLPALFNRQDLKAIESKSKELMRVKAIQDIFHPALTALLSEQVWGKQAVSAPIYPDWTATQAAACYINSDHVYSVINKIAETTALIPFYVYYQKEEKQLKKLVALTSRQFYTTKGIFDIMLMQAKALEDAPETDPVVKLLNNPNQYQSQQEFFLACFCYYLLAGECFIYKYRSRDGANSGQVTELHVLAPSNIILHVTESYPQTVSSYEFVIGGKTIYKEIPVEDIIHIRKFNPDTTLGFDFHSNISRWRGLSPLLPAKKLLTRLSAADDAAVFQLQNGGLPGIIYDKSLNNEDISQPALDLMREHFFGYIRKPENKGAPFFSAGEKGYIEIGLKLADMEVTQLQNIDFKRLCNIYKISTILFNSEVAATESNVEEMVKQMYTNVCLPLAYTFRDKFNSALVNETSSSDKKKRFIDVDISGITELQDDYQQLANVLATLPITPTGNQMLELFKFDRVEDPMMDKNLVKAGYSLLEDLAPMDMPAE